MKASDRLFVGAGLIALPFIFAISAPGEGMREPKARALVFLVGMALSLVLAKRFSWALGAGAALCYVSALFVSPLFPYEELLVFTAALLSCFFFVKPQKDHVEHFLEMLEIGALLCAFYAMVLQLKGADPLLKVYEGYDFRRVSVFFGQHTLYGPFCAAGFASALLRGRFFRAALLFAPIIAISASFTYLSAAVATSIFCIHRFGKTAILSVTAFALLLLLGFGITVFTGKNVKAEALNDNGRFALWSITYRISSARPFKGHGFATFRDQFPIFQSKDLRLQNGIKDEQVSPEAREVLRQAEELWLRSGWFFAAHNEFLQAYYELGLPGVFVSVWLLVSFLMAWIQGERTSDDWALLAIFFSFMANCLGNFPLHLVPQALIPLWAFALVTGARKNDILSLCRPSRTMNFFASRK